MYDRELAIEILRQIYQAAQTILERFQPVKTVSDLTDSPAGMEKLDSLCMLLIAIGEALKNLDKTTNKSLLRQFPQVDHCFRNTSETRRYAPNKRIKA